MLIQVGLGLFFFIVFDPTMLGFDSHLTAFYSSIVSAPSQRVIVCDGGVRGGGAKRTCENERRKRWGDMNRRHARQGRSM